MHTIQYKHLYTHAVRTCIHTKIQVMSSETKRNDTKRSFDNGKLGIPKPKQTSRTPQDRENEMIQVRKKKICRAKRIYQSIFHCQQK
jgi:hypothetical protein